MTSDSASVPPAGWYEDPNDGTTNRYWDGGRWTDSRAPRTATKTEGAAGAGSYVAAIVIPIVGAILAIVQFHRGNTGHGLAILLTAIVAGFVWFMILASVAANDYQACIDNARGLSAMANC